MNKSVLPEATTKEDYRHSPIDFAFVLASSVHDMKNSLGMLMSTLARMMETSPPKDSEQAQFFSTLEYEAARINDELVQLLALYRMDEQRFAIDVDEHHVIDTIEEQVVRNDTLFKTRNIVVTYECDTKLIWYFDNEMLGGVLNNLLINCARYCRAQIFISARVVNNHLCIAVADDGAGYPETMLLQPLNQSGVSFSSGSTRLGLLFAQKVMELHRSKKGQGFLTIANNGLLGGGLLELHLP